LDVQAVRATPHHGHGLAPAIAVPAAIDDLPGAGDSQRLRTNAVGDGADVRDEHVGKRARARENLAGATRGRAGEVIGHRAAAEDSLVGGTLHLQTAGRTVGTAHVTHGQTENVPYLMAADGHRQVRVRRS